VPQPVNVSFLLFLPVMPDAILVIEKVIDKLGMGKALPALPAFLKGDGGRCAYNSVVRAFQVYLLSNV